MQNRPGPAGFHIVARVANLGTRPIDRCRLEARLDGGSTIQEVSNELLPNGPTGIQWYNFRAAFLLNEGATPDYYCIRALDPNDESDDVPGNNERCFNRRPNLLISDPYPNPFTNETVLDIFLPNSDQLEVVLFDGSGKIVQDLFNGKGTKGLNRIRVSGSVLASGVYSLRVIFRDQVLQRHLSEETTCAKSAAFLLFLRHFARFDQKTLHLLLSLLVAWYSFTGKIKSQ